MVTMIVTDTDTDTERSNQQPRGFSYLGVALVVVPAVPGFFADDVNHKDFAEVPSHEPVVILATLDGSRGLEEGRVVYNGH